MFVATLVDVRVAVGIGDGVYVAVGVGARVLDCVGVAVRVSVLVAVALCALVSSNVGELVTTSDDATDTRVCVGNSSLLLHPANIKALNSTNRKMARRINFLLEIKRNRYSREIRNHGSELARACVSKIVERA